jgi:amino acid transporter
MRAHPQPALDASPAPRRLVPVLALRDLIVVAAAAMGPAFSLATTMAAMIAAAGRWTWLALTIVAVLMAMIAVGYRKLGERMRDAGSSYAWIRAAFGPTTGAYGAWVLLVANVFAVLATALPAGTYTLDLLAPALASNALAVALVACAWTLGSAILLWYGLKPTALLAFALLAAEVVVLAGAAGLAAAHPHSDAVAFTHGPPTWSGIVAAIVVGIWMIDGWEVSASTAEEAHGGASVPGAGGLAGLALTSVVLLAAILAFTRIGSPAGYAAHGADALAYVGGLLGGAWPPVLEVTVLVSLAASLQTTLVYLSRSLFAMGRDGLLPRALGELDRRAEPAAAIALVAGFSLAFCLAAGVSPSASGAFAFALQGTSWFLGLLFVLSAAAAVRVFRNERGARWSSVVLPGTAALLLGAILLVSLLGDDTGTRGFIALSAIIGLPLALWRGRFVHRAVGTRGGLCPGVGSFERQRNRFDA